MISTGVPDPLQYCLPEGDSLVRLLASLRPPCEQRPLLHVPTGSSGVAQDYPELEKALTCAMYPKP